MSHTRYTSEEDNFIRKHYRTDMTCAQIARQLGRSPKSVEVRAGLLRGQARNKPAKEIAPSIENAKLAADNARFRALGVSYGKGRAMDV